MAWSFNPFTGNLDLVGGGAVVFEGEVETFADLPQTIGDPPPGSSYLVRTSTGVWLVNRKQAGIWIRNTNNTGVRENDWTYGGDYPVNSVNGQTGTVSLTASSVGAESIFDASSLTLSGTPVTLTAARARVWTFTCFGATTVTLPTTGVELGDRIVVRGGTPVVATISISSSGVSDTITLIDQQISYTYLSTGAGNRWVKNLVDSHDTGRVTSGIFNNARIDWGNPSAIGGTTPNMGSFTSLSVTGQISGANTTASPPTTTGQARGLQFGLLGGNTGSTAAIYGSHPGTSTLGIGIANSSAGSITQVAAFTSTGLSVTGGINATDLTATGTSHTFGVSNPASDTTINLFGAGAANRLHRMFAAAQVGISFQTGSQAVTGPCMASGGVLRLAALGLIRWGTNNNNPAAGSDSIELARDADDTLAQRRGAQPQTFRLYGQITGTDTSATGNYERGYMRWSAAGGTFQIGTEKGSGGGAARALQFQVDGTTRFQITSSGALGLGSVITVWENTAGMYISSNTAGINFNNGLGISTNGGIEAGSAGRFRWKDTGLYTSGSYDLGFQRNSAGVLEINNGTAGTFRDVVVRMLDLGGTTNAFPALKNSSTTLQVRLANDSDFAPLECAGLTLNGNLTASTRNIVTDTTTGTKIGTDPLQKIGFFDKTPVVRPAAVADATDAASVITQLNALLSRMRDLGLIAT